MKSTDDLRGELGAQWRRLRRRHDRPVQIMEVCGTHTVAAARSGLHDLLPQGLRLVSGPGCPVCVTDQAYIDQAVHLARREDVTIATYGDMVRVPGADGSLEQARSEGAAVEVVYAADDAVGLSAERPERQVVFLGIGFETTAPGAALAIRRARAEGASNFSVFSSHKRLLPAMRALLSAGDVAIDGFLCPGHVSVVLGWRAFEPIVAAGGVPCVVAGFEDEQILAALVEIVRQLADGAPRAGNVYPPVAPEGNPIARRVIEEVFVPADARWRGLGAIPDSGLAVREEYADLDAERRFTLPAVEGREPPGCRCGDVIAGRLLPPDCPLFGNACTPRSPVGPCMVSSEGSCAASYRYHRRV